MAAVNQLTWGDLTESQRGIYMNFYSHTVNNQRVTPGNNDVMWSRLIYTPTRGQINTVSNLGDELSRTINYQLTEDQSEAILNWIREHGDNRQRNRIQ